jgi:hypothetical protein
LVNLTDNLKGALEDGENQDEVPEGVGHKKDDLVGVHNLAWEEAVEVAAAVDCRETAAAAAAVVVAVENRKEEGEGAEAGAVEDVTTVVVVAVVVVVEDVVDAMSDAALHSVVHLGAEAAGAAPVAAAEEHVVAVVEVAAGQVAEGEAGAVEVEGQEGKPFVVAVTEVVADSKKELLQPDVEVPP